MRNTNFNCSSSFKGGVEIVSAVDRTDIKATVDFNRYDPKKNNYLPAIIKLPDKISDDITISNVYPALFEIKIEKK